jgi:hypothetical protein
MWRSWAPGLLLPVRAFLPAKPADGLGAGAAVSCPTIPATVLVGPTATTHLPLNPGSIRVWQFVLYGLFVGLVGGWRLAPIPERARPITEGLPLGAAAWSTANDSE